MWEVIGKAAVLLLGGVVLFYIVVLASLFRRGGLENVVPGMVLGALAALAWVALCLWGWM